MNYIKYMINRKRLEGIISELVDKYEDKNKHPVSCKHDLLEAIAVTLDNAKQEISEWKDHDTDYITIAHNQMHMHAFDLLSSGRYHIGWAILSPTSAAPNLRVVFRRCLDYFENRGDLSSEEREQYENELSRAVRSV